MNTHALRDGREPVDIWGDEVGVLGKNTNMREKEKRRSQVRHATPSLERTEGGGGARPTFTLFYDLWLVFSSVYRNC